MAEKTKSPVTIANRSRRIIRQAEVFRKGVERQSGLNVAWRNSGSFLPSRSAALRSSAASGTGTQTKERRRRTHRVAFFYAASIGNA
jgi:hypothetical protein